MDLRQASVDKTTMPTVSQIGDYAPLHPSTRLWEVPRDHVTIDKIVGKGAFGQVAKGKAVELQGRPGLTTVAIKMLKCKTRTLDFFQFVEIDSDLFLFYLVQNIPRRSLHSSIS